jgi:hypothetical protein
MHAMQAKPALVINYRVEKRDGNGALDHIFCHKGREREK